MTNSILTCTRFEEGVWQGHLETEAEPRIEVRYLGDPLEGVSVTQSDKGWDLSIQVPIAALSEGVHSFVIVDTDTTHKLGDFTIIAGSPAADDIRSEVDLLRAELDMLKRAFRRVYSDQG